MDDSTFELLTGHATPEGTKKFLENAVKNKGKPADHFRVFDKLYLSSIGMGTYLASLIRKTIILWRTLFMTLSSQAG